MKLPTRVLICSRGAPYSPDLNPIEKIFSVYKAYLKRFDREDWVRRHKLVLGAVTPKKARNFFRKCSVLNVCVYRKKLMLLRFKIRPR